MFCTWSSGRPSSFISTPVSLWLVNELWETLLWWAFNRKYTIFFYSGGMQFCETCMQAFCLILTSTLSIAYAKTQYISYQKAYTLIESWILKVLLLIRESRWLAVLVHIEFFKWIFCTTMSLYNFPFLRILLCLVWLRQWDILCFYMKKKSIHGGRYFHFYYVNIFL